MSSKLFVILNRLTYRLNQAQISSEKALILSSNVINGERNYHTNTKTRETLYSKLSPLGSPGINVQPELDGWVDKGKKISVAELLRIIHDFRKRKRFTQALEVSEWMNEKGVCKFTPVEHAVQLDLIGRVRGFLSAESYFNSLSEQDQTDKTYGALLNCYVRQRQLDKSLSHLRKMKEMGFASTALTYNDIMCLYTNIGQYEKVPEVLVEMKENKVLPDNYSYRLCINSYGAKSDIEVVANILKEAETQPHMAVDWNTYAVAANFYIKAGLTDKAIDALKKAEVRVDKKDGTAYNHLITLYAKLEKKDDILRLWALEKSACKRCINRDYINVLESLVRINAVEAAEEVLKEWESSDNCYDFRVRNIVTVAYLDKGMLEKAEAMLVSEKEKGSSPNTWGLLAARYQEKGEMHKAVSCMKAGLSFYVENKGWKPNRQVIYYLLNWIGDEGSVEDVASFVKLLRNAVPVNRQMYHALIKAHLRHGKDVDGILEEMKVDQIKENEETKSILSTIPTNT
ncbi:pentatricopeptide repeat-containing protein At4g21705, mitochondrial-like [Chenopodium quinoa]|uniref:Pentatricopeptide repeat-containing protein n=1 Tax=Chenopodium quinoa TaxID=63459 RepID=A0A803LLG1_CHEQI|nr:pentatricopeptide repeat-containing protein At4g21705, mitochondrial-like [Chenopodium quinoa]